MTMRQFIGLAALLLSSWLAFFADKTPNDDASIVVPTRSNAARALSPLPAGTGNGDRGASRAPGTANQGAAAPAAVLALAQRLPAPPPDSRHSLAMAFGARSWTPPPPPPEPVVPQAPSLPFTFLGKQWQSGNWQVYLALGEDTHLAREATVIDGRYRVESIVPPQIVFTYLPLNERQTLDIGAP
jgi:hypothetical protein